MAKKTVMDVDVKGKRVLVRVDYNVPLNDAGEVADDKRITASLPTVNYLLEHGARVILCSHLGRPKGEPKPEFSLKPVAVRLAQLLPNVKIGFAEDCIGPEAKRKAMALNDGEILLLENLRFHKEEEKNDSAFAKELASLAELYVSDAFGTVHRAHASTAGVAAYLPAVAGFLIGKELSIMGDALEKPERPFVAILGGAKVADKIGRYKVRVTSYTTPKLNCKSATIKRNKTKQLKVSGGLGTIKWSSSNRRIAVVNSKGKVTGKKKGTCYIYARRNGYGMSCKVRIK